MSRSESSMSVSRCRSVLDLRFHSAGGLLGQHERPERPCAAGRSRLPRSGRLGSARRLPTVESMVRALPDFSPLVEKYGPAVVNVEVVEKAQPQGGPQGLSPNDPFYDFFRRFGIPTPDQGQRGNAPPVRGAGSGFHRQRGWLHPHQHPRRWKRRRGDGAPHGPPRIPGQGCRRR